MLFVGYTQSGITSPIFVEETQSDPMYGEWQQRFNPPGSGTRNINTIALSDSNSISSGNLTVTCYVKLDDTCVQDSNEIIDIFYRVQFLHSYSEGVATFALRGVARDAVLGDSSNYPSSMYTYFNGSWAKKRLL